MTFVFSRPRTLLALLTLPFFVLKLAAVNTYRTFRDELADVLPEVPSVIRYIVTGNPTPGSIISAAKAIPAATSAKALSLFAVVMAFLKKHVGNRATTVFIALVVPFAFIWFCVEAVRDNKPWEGLGALFVDLGRDFIAARDSLR